MLHDVKFYVPDGFIVMRFQGKKCYHVSASALPENADPIIRSATGYQGQLNWQYYKWSGVYELDQQLNTKEQK